MGRMWLRKYLVCIGDDFATCGTYVTIENKFSKFFGISRWKKVFSALQTAVCTTLRAAWKTRCRTTVFGSVCLVINCIARQKEHGLPFQQSCNNSECERKRGRLTEIEPVTIESLTKFTQCKLEFHCKQFHYVSIWFTVENPSNGMQSTYFHNCQLLKLYRHFLLSTRNALDVFLCPSKYWPINIQRFFK